MDPLCRIQLLGGLRVFHADGREITRFQTVKTGLLLAYLGIHTDRRHPREVLMELLWPNDEPESSRHKLRMSLSSLRRQLEPPGVPAGAVIQADRQSVVLNPSLVKTDVAEFGDAIHDAAHSESSVERVERLESASVLYRGELLPGLYDDWIIKERDRLAESYLTVLRKLTRGYVELQVFDRALEAARRAVEVDPLREELHRDLMRLLAASGQPSAAIKQYRRLEGTLSDQLQIPPSADSQALAARLSQNAPRDPRAAAPPQVGAQFPTGQNKSAAVDSAATDTPGTLRSLRLPLYLDRCFGRESEVENVLGLLTPGSPGHTRLITLTGPGGSGKTRFAVEAAHRVADSFGGNVWFCGLADLADAARIPDALRSALCLPPDLGIDPLTQVCRFLGERQTCILLDNFEHLVQGGPLIVRTLLEQASGLTVLVTSRCPVGLSGEREVPVMPLPLPGAEETAEALVLCASVQMFVDRAQAVRPDFQVTSRLAPDVAAICRGLEGIPLAIELAAARAKTLSVAQMLQGLHDRFDLLVSRKRDVPERHRSLCAAIDWSYQLLSPDAQRFFTRLAVFSGGFTHESAAAICEDSGAAKLLEPLTDASLIGSTEQEGEVRFRMLETLREFAWNLLTSGEQQALCSRHAHYYIQMAESAEPLLEGRQQATLLDRLDRENDNLHAALKWLRNHHPDSALRLCGHLCFFWGSRHVRDGYMWVTDILSLPETSKDARAKGLWTAARLAKFQGNAPSSLAHFNEYLDLCRALSDRRGMAEALRGLGNHVSELAHYDQARTYYEESQKLFREVGHLRGVAGILNNLGLVAFRQGEFAVAERRYRECLAIMRELAEPEVATVLTNLGDLACEQGNLEGAQTCYEEALDLRRGAGYEYAIAYALGRLARLARLQRDFPRARMLHSQCLEVCKESGVKANLAWDLEEMAALEAWTGRTKRAAILLGAAGSARKAIQLTLHPVELANHDRTLWTTRDALGDEGFSAQWTRGANMTLDQAIEYALQEESGSQK